MTPKSGSQARLSIQVFDRQQIARIVGISPALIRNWSMGKPFLIEPSVRAPGKRGSANLYTLEDVYVFGVVARLSEIGIKPAIINEVISWAQKRPVLLDPEWEGIVNFYVSKADDVVNISEHRGVPTGFKSKTAWFLSVSKDRPLSAGVIFAPREVQLAIDERIAELVKEGKL